MSLIANTPSVDYDIAIRVRNLKAVAAQAKLAVKGHYTFDFLELPEAHEERELEAALIANVQRFLTEMGSHFTFVGSQYRLGGGEIDT